jgi:sec-independent protein translocase protein TatA
MHLPLVVLFLNLGSGEIIIVVLCIVMFFGTDKLPEMARAFGKGMKQMKNATAEIQREIEKGATEIQRDLNLGEEISDLKKATDKLTGSLKESLDAIEEHHHPKTEIAEEGNEGPEPENPLTPPEAIKRD